jgi:hypothetical protein
LALEQSNLGDGKIAIRQKVTERREDNGGEEGRMAVDWRIYGHLQPAEYIWLVEGRSSVVRKEHFLPTVTSFVAMVGR